MKAGIVIHPKFRRMYKLDNNSDYTALLGSKMLEEFDLPDGIKLILPKFYNDNNGFAIKDFNKKLIFSKAIFLGESEEQLRALQLKLFWLGHNPELKTLETKRIAIYQ